MFFTHVIQDGEGCDYTIGCGHALWELSATTKDEAIEELKMLMSNEDTGELLTIGQGRPFYKKVVLFETVNETEMPIADWYAESKARAERRATQAQEDADRAEFERLRAKFNA